MRINISMDDSLVARLDDYCKKNYIKRSGFISSAVNRSLNESESLGYLKSLAFAMNKIADTSTIDSETKSILDDFARFAELFVAPDLSKNK